MIWVRWQRWRVARAALQAVAADDVPLGGHQVAHREQARGRRVPAQLHDLARELVPDHHRRLEPVAGPAVPLPDVQVGAADAGVVHPDQDVVRAEGRRRGRPAPPCRGRPASSRARACDHWDWGWHGHRRLAAGDKIRAPSAELVNLARSCSSRTRHLARGGRARAAHPGTRSCSWIRSNFLARDSGAEHVVCPTRGP